MKLISAILSTVVGVAVAVFNFLNYPWFKAPTAAEIDAFQEANSVTNRM